MAWCDTVEGGWDAWKMVSLLRYQNPRNRNDFLGGIDFGNVEMAGSIVDSMG